MNIKSLALRALAEARGVPCFEASPVPIGTITEIDDIRAVSGTLAPCGSHHCAGCYEIDGRRRIHPAKCSGVYLAQQVLSTERQTPK
jgi:hypothetical protein